MRKLIDTPNIEGVTADYPKGRIKDRVGAVPGTTLTELGLGDLIQLAQKLVIDAAIVENDLPDNVTNGYQLLEALNAKINERTKLDTTFTELRAAALFNSGTITITAETYDRIIYIDTGGTLSTSPIYYFIINIDGNQIGTGGYLGITTIHVPATKVATLVYQVGTGGIVGIKEQKIGL